MLYRMIILCVLFFFFKQKTAYELRISDWSSDVCSSDLLKFEAQSTTQLQNQIDALNGAMGDLTNRLVGFTTEIDTNVLTAGQVLVTVDAGLTPGGAQLYTFQPVDYSFANLVDVDIGRAHV